MCKKLSYCNPRIDKCLIELIKEINNNGIYKTLSSCCGHGKYPKTIVVKEKSTGNVLEYFSNIPLQMDKRNRYYKKDSEDFYFIPQSKYFIDDKLKELDGIRTERRTVVIEGYEYEIGNPNAEDCPTPQACMYCHWMRFVLPCNQLCLFPKLLYGNTKAYREYVNTKISIKELIEKYSKN